MKTYFLIAALAILAACSPAKRAMQMEEAAASGIAASNEKFMTAFDAGDAKAIAALYAEDAVLLPPNAPNAKGRAGAEKLWGGVIKAKVQDLRLMRTKLDVQGDTATELGRYSVSVPTAKGGRVTVGGNYIVLWTRGADKVWRLKWDIWNNDPPAK